MLIAQVQPKYQHVSGNQPNLFAKMPKVMFDLEFSVLGGAQGAPPKPISVALSRWGSIDKSDKSEIWGPHVALTYFGR